MDASVPPPIAGPPESVKRIAGIEGMTPAQIQEAVVQGARFVIFQFCVSVLVMSFKRSSPICFIRPGKGAFGKGAPYTLISLVGGWWGIPWGPIWTLTTMATNISGGKDVTRQVLAAHGLPMPAVAQRERGR